MSDDPDVYETGFIEHIEIFDDTEDVKNRSLRGAARHRRCQGDG